MKNFLILVFGCLLLALSGAGAAALTLQINDNDVRACGLEAGGEVGFMSVSWSDQAWVPRINTAYEVVADEDGDGCAVMLFEPGVVRAMVVAAADQQTGSYQVVASPSISLVDEALPMESLTGPAQARDGFEVEAGDLRALLVRPGPGGGIWGVVAGDGGSSDADGTANGKVLVQLRGMRRLRGVEAPPPRLLSGDVVIIVDARATRVLHRTL